LLLDHSTSIDEVDRQIAAHKVEMVLVRRVFTMVSCMALSSRTVELAFTRYFDSLIGEPDSTCRFEKSLPSTRRPFRSETGQVHGLTPFPDVNRFGKKFKPAILRIESFLRDLIGVK